MEDCKIPIFTNDIVNIVIKKISKDFSPDEIHLHFSNRLDLFATDDQVDTLIPSFCDTRHYQMVHEAISTLKGMNRAVSRKRKIFGIDPNDFVCKEDFQQQLLELVLMFQYL